MDSQKYDENAPTLCEKETKIEAYKVSTVASNNSVAQVNSKDELNWVENEIVIIDSLNNKVTESDDNVTGSIMNVSNTELSNESNCKTTTGSNDEINNKVTESDDVSGIIMKVFNAELSNESNCKTTSGSNDEINNKVTESDDNVSGSIMKVFNAELSKESNCKTTTGSNDENENKLWEYFTEHNSSQLRCNLCLGLFLYQSNASHLLKHVEVVHKVPVLADNKSIEDNVTPSDLKTSSNTKLNSGLPVRQSLESSTDKETSARIFPQSIQRDAVVSSELSNKVHEYFTRLESGKMRCNLCCRVLSYDSDKSTIFRHLYSNHGDTYQFIIESTSCEDYDFAKDVNDIGLAGVATQNKKNRKKKKKVICIGEYFTELEATDRVKCKYCRAVLKYSDGIATNLVRHLKSKHKDMLFKKDLPSVQKTKASNSMLVLEIIQVDDKCLITNAQLEIENKANTVMESTSNNLSGVNGMEELESNQSYYLVENIVKNNKSEEDGKIKFWENNQEKTFRDYFTKLHTNDIVKCNICSKVIRCNDSTKKLLNHLLTDHGVNLPKLSESCNSFEFETFVSETGSQKDDNLNFEYELKSELTVNDITNIHLPSIMHSNEDNRLKMMLRKPKIKVNSMSSRLWKFFTKLYRGKAICNICDKAVSYKLGQISYLVKHLQMKHRVLQLKSDKRNTNKKNTKVNKTDIVWKFFTKLDNSKAECNLCEHINVHYYSSRSRSNLMKHIRLKHKHFLDLYRDSRDKVIKDEGTVTEINNISQESIDERPEINMKTLFAYFSNDTSLQKWIKFENDQIVCKLCTGMFICDNLLDFESMMKNHIETCHEFALLSLASACNRYSSDNDDEHESETDEQLEVLSDSSYNELEGISREISSFTSK